MKSENKAFLFRFFVYSRKKAAGEKLMLAKPPKKRTGNKNKCHFSLYSTTANTPPVLPTFGGSYFYGRPIEAAGKCLRP